MGRWPWAAIGVSLSAVAVIAGSLITWGTCPNSSCGGDGGLMVLVDRSGVDFGPGNATLLLGLLLVVVGLDAIRRGGSSELWWVALIAALVTFGVIVGFVFTTYVFDHRFYGPGEGVFLVALGAAASAVTSTRARPPGPADSRVP